jgi:hypothetical protein
VTLTWFGECDESDESFSTGRNCEATVPSREVILNQIGPAYGPQNPIATVLADDVGDGPFTLKTGILGLSPQPACDEEHRVDPLTTQRTGVLVQPRRVAVVGQRLGIFELSTLAWAMSKITMA